MRRHSWLFIILVSACAAITIGRLAMSRAAATNSAPAWESDNPIRPLPAVPIGVGHSFGELAQPPTPPRVRLGRWLFFDTRLSSDDTIACATCHRPANAFSEPTPHSTGIAGQAGVRKSPTFVNAAWSLYPNFFWDGRAGSLEAQALGPVANAIEMGNTHEAMVRTLSDVKAYAPYFQQAFGSPEVTAARVAQALADYERTRLSGNSPFDRWQIGRDESAVTPAAKRGYQLFAFGKAACNQCHLGPNLADSAFHNLGVGYDAGSKTFTDNARYDVTKLESDRGAFKTPTLRDIARHAPYMHDGSQPTLRSVVEFYNRGGNANPHLDSRMKPLGLTPGEVDDLVAFLESLNGEGYEDAGPIAFPG